MERKIKLNLFIAIIIYYDQTILMRGTYMEDRVFLCIYPYYTDVHTGPCYRRIIRY